MNFQSGDIIAVSEKGLQPCLRQIASFSLPNLGPFGRWGLSGASHIGIICWRYGEPMVFESKNGNYLSCEVTGRENPIGGQAHHVSDFTGLDINTPVWHYPLASPLYYDEEKRLSDILEYWLGRGITDVGMCIEAMATVGRIKPPRRPVRLITPQSFVRWGRINGTWMKGIRL